MLKNLSYMILTLLILINTSTRLFAGDNLAVLKLDNKGVSETEASVITDRLRINLFETGKFTVIEREKMEEILSEQKFQMTGCTSTECVIEAGNILGVAMMVTGSVTKIGNTYSINARLIDVETGEIKNTAVYDIKGEIDKLLTGVENVSQALAGLKSSNNYPKQNSVIEYDNMVFVEGGSFTMGSNKDEDDEKPSHEVTVNSFYIGKYEVTQKEWLEIMGNNPSKLKGDNFPVGKISWYDAVEYCNKRSLKENLTPCYVINDINTICDFNANGYRLPTEAEWEYAARGGNKSRGYQYSGSNELEKVSWYSVNSRNKTHAKGEKIGNELGIYDLGGNVNEWCWDWYEAYSSIRVANPLGPFNGEFRVLRGGSWGDNSDYCRVTNRLKSSPDNGYINIGFRVARSALTSEGSGQR